MAPNLSSRKWALSHLIMVLILGLTLYQFFGIYDPSLTVSFLDVGQGDAILIQTPEYKNILIDAGPDSSVIEKLGQELNFFNQKIDLFILTHPDLDHYGGSLDLLQKFPIQKVMITGIAGSSSLYQAFLKELKMRNIPIKYPTNIRDLHIGQGVYLDLLYPFSTQSLVGQEAKNKNDSSISLILRDQNQTPLMLLTGDAEEKQEHELLLSGQDINAAIFKLGHHGSKTASNSPFLAAINPSIAVASVGEENKFGHPHLEVLERLGDIPLKRTDKEGTIHFVLK